MREDSVRRLPGIFPAYYMLKTSKSKNVQIALKHRKWVENEIDLPLKNGQKYISKKFRSTFKGVEDENHVIKNM